MAHRPADSLVDDDVLLRGRHHLFYRDLGTDGRKARAPFSDEALSSIFRWNATALDETPSWPLERYLDYVKGIDEQVDFDGVGGDFRIAYSPATMMHWLRNYRRVLECAKNKTQFEAGAEPVDAKNHAGCLDSEFPTDAALVKAQWFRSDFGMQLPSYDTTPESLQVRLGPDGSKQWGPGDSQADPDATKAHTVRLRNGSRYRLGALHIVTKELRHWVWITLWWSPQPDGGFGADRPESIRKLGGAWSNYNMCVVTDYTEGDEDPVGRFRDKYPQLSAALAAVQAGKGQPTWCSNGYVERGRGNANTNCIGCHQHAGTGARTRDIIDSEAFPHNGRTQLRQNFPGDYAWSFDRGDNISRFIFAEKAGGIDDGKLDPTPVARAVNTVARGAGHIFDDGASLADQPVEEGRFANVGASDDDDDWFGQGCTSRFLIIA